MPSWSFARDSLIVAAVVVLLAWAVSLTAQLALTLGGGGNGAVANPGVIALLYAVAAGLLFVLWKSQVKPARA